MECIILAGGAGTRLASVVADKPKYLANINGKPFLQILIENLEQQGFQHVILALGYMHEQVIDWLKGKAFLCKVTWVIERNPLGTGGAIKLALNKAKDPLVCIIHGDTLYKVDYRALFSNPIIHAHKVTMALKPMEHFDRYGAVSLHADHTVRAFKEKQPTSKGLINGGVYILNRILENLQTYPDAFSFEKDFLETEVVNGSIAGLIQDAYFMDIGILEDYEQIQKDLS